MRATIHHQGESAAHSVAVMHQPIETLEQIIREQARQIGQLGDAVRSLTQAAETLLHEISRIKDRVMLLEAGQAIDELDEHRTMN